MREQGLFADIAKTWQERALFYDGYKMRKRTSYEEKFYSLTLYELGALLGIAFLLIRFVCRQANCMARAIAPITRGYG